MIREEISGRIKNFELCYNLNKLWIVATIRRKFITCEIYEYKKNMFEISDIS